MRSSVNAKTKERWPHFTFAFAFIRERKNQEAVILGRTSGLPLRSSMNARVKKRPSLAALLK
jgi:hypothetical protein